MAARADGACRPARRAYSTQFSRLCEYISRAASCQRALYAAGAHAYFPVLCSMQRVYAFAAVVFLAFIMCLRSGIKFASRKKVCRCRDSVAMRAVKSRARCFISVKIYIKSQLSLFVLLAQAGLLHDLR